MTSLLAPVRERFLLLFLCSVVLCSALEWVTGFVLEKLFHQKWWDYSDQPFNLNGYICPLFSLLWGFACLIIMDMIHPAVMGILLIYRGRIVALSPDEDQIQVKEVFDGQGLYAIPGLIDAHLHFESQLAHPTALGEAMVPNGTTTIFAECLDLIGSAGEEGLEAFRMLFKDYDMRPPEDFFRGSHL